MQDHLVFISYASPDFGRVLPYYESLAAAGYNVWMDKKKLKGGQDWDFEIKKALKRAAIIVLFISANSFDRRGYVQREIQIALDQRKEKLIDDIYVVPVLLDEGVKIPDQLSGIHVIRAYEVDAALAVQESIDEQLTRLGVETARSQGDADVRWSGISYKDVWDGLPGYETAFELVNFSSGLYPKISEATDVIRGWLTAQAMEERELKLGTEQNGLNFGEPRWRRTYTWDAFYSEPKIRGRVLSVLYSISTYSGGAHGNHGFKTFVFTLDPVTHVASLEKIFTDPDAALAIIRGDVRTQLLINEDLEKGWVEGGTEDWKCFSNFVFNDDGIELFFAPYEVAAYAFGPQSACVKYDKIAHLFSAYFASALETQYLPRPTADGDEAPASDQKPES